MKRKPKASAAVDRSPEANCNRLLRLARLLRSLALREFDMGCWVERRRGRKSAKKSCGTICCVGGWATSVHPDLELVLNGVKNNQTSSYGANALEHAFGISCRDALHLTSGGSPHQKPSQAAAAVEKVAAKFAKKHHLSIRYE